MWVKVRVPLADRCPEGCSDVMPNPDPQCWGWGFDVGFRDFMWVKVRVPLADFALDVLRDVAISWG